MARIAGMVRHSLITLFAGDRTPGGAANAVLMETGSGLLLEDGSGVILMES